MWFRHLTLTAWRILFFISVFFFNYFPGEGRLQHAWQWKNSHRWYTFQRCAIRLTGTRKHQRPKKNVEVKGFYCFDVCFIAEVDIFLLAVVVIFFYYYCYYFLSFLAVPVSFRSLKVCQSCKHKSSPCLNETTWNMKIYSCRKSCSSIVRQWLLSPWGFCDFFFLIII